MVVNRFGLSLVIDATIDADVPVLIAVPESSLMRSLVRSSTAHECQTWYEASL